MATNQKNDRLQFSSLTEAIDAYIKCVFMSLQEVVNNSCMSITLSVGLGCNDITA